MDQNYCWKVTNDEGFIPTTVFYTSDRVAALDEQLGDRTVTIVAWD